MAIPHFRYSFANGFKKLTLEDSQKVRQEICDLLGCTSKVEYCRKKNHYRDIPQHIYRGISAIFARYGVSESDVWTIQPLKP